MKKMPIIIDCDPGIDDVLALMMLYKYKHLFDLKLISVCAGNVPIEVTTKNAKYVAHEFFDGVRIARGTGKALKKVNPENAEDVFGIGGLGNFYSTDVDYPCEDDAVESMYDVLSNSKEQISLICLGPMSNIARLFIKYPEVKAKIDKIYCMIGSITGIGNIKDWAEFNAYFDPDAFKVVAESGLPLFINPMETSHNTRIKKSLVAGMPEKNKYHKMIKLMVEGLYEYRDPGLFTIFDLNAIYSIIKPELYTLTKCDIKITTRCKYAGKCLLPKNEKSIHAYYDIIDADKCNSAIIEDLLSIE